MSERVARLVAQNAGVDEPPIACLRGRADQSLVVFDDRVLVVKPRLLMRGLLGTRVTTLFLRDISAIHVSTRIVNGWIELATPVFPRPRRRDVEQPQHRLPNSIPIRRRRLALYQPVLAELRSRIAAAKATAAAPRDAPEHVLSELERLGALRLTGILSHDEFERAKRLLLETPEAA